MLSAFMIVCDRDVKTIPFHPVHNLVIISTRTGPFLEKIIRLTLIYSEGVSESLRRLSINTMQQSGKGK